MKQLTIIILLCIESMLCAAQVAEKSDPTVTDKVLIRAYYQFSKREEGSEKPYRTDTLLLDIGQKLSKFYDPARLGRDSMVNARMKNLDASSIKSIHVYRGEEAIGAASLPGTISSSTNEGESYQIIKLKPQNTVTVLDYIEAIKDRFKFEDKFEPLKWEIKSVKDTLLSYTCQLATTSFRGRNYKAWFTTDIPVNDGPWKFSGLPGLILKAEDDKGLFVFTLVGLERGGGSLPIRIDDSERITSTRKDFEKLKKKQSGGMRINVNSGNVILAEIPATTAQVAIELE